MVGRTSKRAVALALFGGLVLVFGTNVTTAFGSGGSFCQGSQLQGFGVTAHLGSGTEAKGATSSQAVGLQLVHDDVDLRQAASQVETTAETSSPAVRPSGSGGATLLLEQTRPALPLWLGVLWSGLTAAAIACVVIGAVLMLRKVRR